MDACDKKLLPIFNPSPFRISTITAVATFNTAFNLDALYQGIEIITQDNNVGVLYAEFGKKKFDVFSCKGYHKKQSITRRKIRVTKRFDNQVTILIKLREGYQVNMKIFKNSNVQMTGLKYIDQGNETLEYVFNMIKDIEKNNNVIVSESPEPMIISGFRVCLINSDFKLGFPIKREKLTNIIQNSTKILCSFEPCIYPPSKIQFNWNVIQTEIGVCPCTNKCNGKGKGCGDGDCKRVTIAVFASGCVIITGAHNNNQIKCAYDFITDIVKDNLSEVYKPDIPQIDQVEPKKRGAKSKKNKILDENVLSLETA